MKFYVMDKNNIDKRINIHFPIPIPITEKLLREYFFAYKPNEYLFTGQKGSEYSARSIQQIMKVAAKKCNILKNISTHSLRHSCFTQLIKNGVDIRSIQRLAGHKNISTTAQYLRICDNDILQIKSPILNIKL